MHVELDNVILITKAAVSLHNFTRQWDGHMVDRTSSIAYKTRDNDVADGLQPLALNVSGGRATDDVIKVREALSKIFSDPNGSVER